MRQTWPLAPRARRNQLRSLPVDLRALPPQWHPLHARKRRPAHRTAKVVAVGAALAGLAALLYFLSVRSEPPSSDGATIVLEAKAVANGNLALKGWSLSFDSLWTLDVPVYVLAVALSGARSLLLEAVPAAIAASAVVAAAWVARSGRRGAPAVVAACATVSLLGLPSHTLAIFLLKGGLHVTTALWCLLAFAALRRGRFGWGWLASVALFATALLGDLLALAFGVVPACLAGLVAMARARSWRAGAAPVSAALAGSALAAGSRELADAIGSFSLVHVQSDVQLHKMLANAKALPANLAHLLGAGAGFYGTGGVPGALQSAHVAGLLVVVVALVASFGALVHGAATGGPASTGGSRVDDGTGAPRAHGAPFAGRGPVAVSHRPGTRPSSPAPGWRLDDMVLLGALGSLFAYVALARSANPAYSRYLTPAVIFGAVLAGRLLGRLTSAARLSLKPRAAMALGAVLIGCFAAGTGLQLAQPTPPQATARLATFLAQHDLRAGLGDYWCSSVVTVQSGGKVVVRPVIANAHGRLVRYARQTSAGWYAGHDFGFFVFNTTQSFGGASQRSAARTFGPPSRTMSFGPYRVLIWPHPVEVSPVGLAT